MIPAGYMYRAVSRALDEMPTTVIDIYSMGESGHPETSKNFADYILHWKHNGYWIFNKPEDMEEIARKEGIDLSCMTLFFYELYELESSEDDETTWVPFKVDESFETDVLLPETKTLVGFDVVEYATRSNPECSLLSCCGLAGEFEVNSHCLFDTFDQAKDAVETGKFHDLEPGPYRIVAVYLVP